MHSMKAALCLAIMAPMAYAANLADVIKSNPQLQKVAALISSNPTWATVPNGTLFVPSDAALSAATLPAGWTGISFTTRTIDHRVRPNYQVVDDASGKFQFIFDNYTPGDANPEIHIRFGVGETLAPGQLQADNGWVYVMNAPIPQPLPPTKTMPFQNCNLFAKALQDAGLAAYVDSLPTYTILAPNDAAWTAASAKISALTLDQLKATLMYHILPTSMVSTLLNAGQISTALSGNTVSLVVGGESATFNQAKLILADVFSANGVMHIVDAVLTPPNMPTGPVPIPGVPTPIASSASSAATASANAPASTNANGKAPTAATGSSTNGAMKVVGGLIGSVVAGLAALVVI
ncbi:hypothetical protein BATDEDRAFT_35182 [Batrachochytrium dendrobatidis JAM81]|uniref:FAS1 domain-containing protein n=1 Tax=Batrachochytrium dendrobatidis (strain JAM81 / FGSC 10211) TaxID=684364 RepID=F4P4T8_BATDJ|nr:uncharacterized protein BATDEDRAFT_35182 [Batrachochytrium dendrobatidis JAM81]EGF79632.1 hypothetical protein BATDEDRAFT_35182 [Batrachochytrium dendrobatidis JAM81]|eukprot:XP_006679532.1 hypothetical protein BATDEDRAFT_35182 [Batrachochytrium dendrobatidis JAM81]